MCVKSAEFLFIEEPDIILGIRMFIYPIGAAVLWSLIEGTVMEAQLTRIASAKLQDRALEMASAVMKHQMKMDATLASRLDSEQRNACMRDIYHHLMFLSSAIRYRSKIMFESYVEWLKVLMATLNVPIEDLITNFKCIEKALAEDFDVEPANLCIEYLGVGHKRLLNEDRPSVIHFGESIELSVLTTQYMNLILNRDIESARNLVAKAIDSHLGIKKVYTEILGAAQYEIGRLWLNGELNVAQEHYFTSATQLIMAQVGASLRPSKMIGRRVFLTCAPGELHDMGLRILRDVFAAEGWDTVYVGCNTPISDAVDMMRKTKPDILAISVTMPYSLLEAENLIASVRNSPDLREIKILVGGNPFKVDDELWKRVGADGFGSNAEEAVKVAAELLSDVQEHTIQ